MLTRLRILLICTSLSVSFGQVGIAAEETNKLSVLSGRVIDDQGKPIVNADVRVGRYRSSAVNTDEDGRFQIRDLRKGRITLFVAAALKGPSISEVMVGDAHPHVIQMKHAKSIQFKVVDHQGRGVENAAVQVTRWGPKGISFPIGVVAQTDAHGTAKWGSAPDMVVQYSIQAPGFIDPEPQLVAGGDPHRIVLDPVLRITGTARDANTGRPLEKFTFVPIVHGSSMSFLDRLESQEFQNGRFAVEFNRPGVEQAFQLEAFGYSPVRSRRYRNGEASDTADFRLQRTLRYAGKVTDEQGDPIAGATVYVATQLQHLSLSEFDPLGKVDSSNYAVTTDEQGAFEIHPQNEPYALVVVSNAGFVEQQRHAGQPPDNLQLRPWAKVTGRLVNAGRPVAAWTVRLETIRFSGPELPVITLRCQTATDSNGRFRFERVSPGPVRVVADLHFSIEAPISSSRSFPLLLAPGEHAEIELGGGGTEVLGQIALDPGREGIDYRFSTNYLLSMQPGVMAPPVAATHPFDWKKGWNDLWICSPEGGEYLRTLHQFSVKPEPDGRIRVSGVPPGDYQLAIKIYEATDGCMTGPLGQRIVRFTVPQQQAELNLGTLKVPAHPSVKIGETAPEFEFRSRDGQPTKLSNMRGRFVLLDFWATWCGACVATLGEVEQLRKRFSTDDRLVVIGMNLDENVQAADDFLKRRSLPWEHVMLGSWEDSDLPRRYGISSLPNYVLIGPDGRLVAQDTSLDAIERQLESLVGKRDGK